MGGQLGWDGARVEREVADWYEVARAEGLVPEAAGVRVPDRGAEEPSPAAPGAAPEEAA